MMPEKIHEIFVLVSSNGKQGEEILCAPQPLVAANLGQIQAMLPLAEATAQQNGQTCRVLRFSSRQDITEDLL